MISVVIASTWMNMGGATLIYLAALQNIPGELYEAAELDGAGLLRKIRHITIPQTKLILSMLLMLQIVATMQMFVEAFILTNGGAGVNDNTVSVVNLIYQYAFAISGASNFNSASALGVMLMLVLAVFSGGYLWLTRDRRGTDVNLRSQDADLQRPAEPGRAAAIIYRIVLTLVIVVFTLVFIGPLYFLFSDGLKSTQEAIPVPPTLIPPHVHLSTYAARGAGWASGGC